MSQINTSNPNYQLISLSPQQRTIVQPLFHKFPYLRGEVAAVVYGRMGQVFVTSLTEPEAALAILDFRYLAGDPDSEAALALVQSLEANSKNRAIVAPSEAWRKLLLSQYPNSLKVRPREAFQAGDFDIEHLRRLTQGLAEGFMLKKVEPHEVAQFASDLHPALVYNWASHEEFIEKSFGFGVVHQGRFVSGVSAAAIGNGKVEFEVQTDPNYVRRGLAAAASAAMILHCLELNLEPCWDAANPPSSGLARKLGFQSSGQYNAYILT
jgi:hypothetical protein